MEKANFEVILKKIILLAKRKPGLTPQQFREHYEQRHAPLALNLLSGIHTYRRNYVNHDLIYRPPHLDFDSVGPDFDVITEMTFQSEDDYQKMVNGLADPKLQAQIVEDSKRFIDRDSMKMFFVDEETSVAHAGGHW